MADLAEPLAELPTALVEALFAQLRELEGEELVTGDHVKLLLVERRAVRANLFVDTDGTLWVVQVAVAGQP